MQLSEALFWGVQSIKLSGIQDAHVDILAFLSHVLVKEKSYIYSNLSMQCPDVVFKKFSSMVEERVRHEPSAYIMGKREFMSLNFMVNKNVLIPRPETEHLVEETLTLFPQADGSAYVGLDIGTGCGNIALSLAKYNRNFHIYATDISSKAIKVARENRKLLNLEKSVSFINCNLWNYFKKEKWRGRINVLASNPPYVRSGQLNDFAVDLSYEPKKALDGGADGLSFYKPLADAGEFLLKKNGYLIMEIGQGQEESVKNILRNKKVFQDIIVKKDYSGIDRIIVARRK
ncbi:MAG: peptide chain release factor N(5)-glutamine methyltransferase [Candidatus Omnitrophota bacterium]